MYFLHTVVFSTTIRSHFFSQSLKLLWSHFPNRDQDIYGTVQPLLNLWIPSLTPRRYLHPHHSRAMASAGPWSYGDPCLSSELMFLTGHYSVSGMRKNQTYSFFFFMSETEEMRSDPIAQIHICKHRKWPRVVSTHLNHTQVFINISHSCRCSL